MTGRTGRGCRVAAALLTAVACGPAPARAAAPPPSAERVFGVVTWAASADRMGEGTAGRGYRLIVHLSVGGTGLRVRVTNAFGDRPLTLDSGYAGLRGRGAALRPGSNRRLTFGGARTLTVPAGAVAWSDPVPGTWPAGTDLAVSLHTPDAAGPATGHWMALQTSYTAHGEHTAEDGARNWAGTTGSWWYLDAVSVRPSRAGTGAVAVLGDSLTDGRQSTPDRDRRWPDDLARRLNTSRTHIKGVADEGLSGNKVLADDAGPSALDRLHRDVLSQPGVRTVFLFEGVNDLKAHTGVTAAELIAGYRKIARRVHGAGKCLVVATVGPFKGWPEWDTAAESVRQEVNRFLRTGRDFDAVTDFDRVLRSPDDPERIRPAYDGGDHLHPGDRGMRALADAVDLDDLDCTR
ncbi:G-D-S-L family lipolytic protein [Streptomyces yokosukanensis]|uniref:G-D-S-L family lipolytic protein n=1 Tax=Streptomyces yokosukanensis TaxID=67386 RepID=A0A101P6K0_9ACTN|nr:SGNH/GDSL hydrolase family protein [Streptomyces yokosukanensis]KUN05853.1 G-D-S-L family lipolytic protein [Streptomyces yokosukanensis]